MKILQKRRQKNIKLIEVKCQEEQRQVESSRVE